MLRRERVQRRARARPTPTLAAPARSYHGRSRRSNSCSRSLRCRSGSGIFTGHTTPHWLHIVDACGRSSAFSRPTYIGVRIEPIGPGIHPAVRVAADVLVDRAVVHARAAADAAQRLPTSLASTSDAPAVDEDEVHVLGAVEFARALDAGQDVDVVRDRLPGRRARQQPHQRRDVLERRHDLLDAGDRDVHFRQRRRQRRVAFVGDHDDRPRFGDEEVAARDAHVGGQVVRAQHPARLEAQLVDPVLPRLAVPLVEQLRDLVAAILCSAGPMMCDGGS